MVGIDGGEKKAAKKPGEALGAPFALEPKWLRLEHHFGQGDTGVGGFPEGFRRGNRPEAQEASTKPQIETRCVCA